jgi:tripartite-type tricarboxylate transporter receptor subunit TctC
MAPVTWPTDPVTFVSHGPAGSGPHLMMSALAASFVAAGSPVAPEVEALPGQDGGDAIRRTAAAATTDEWLLASCTPSWLTTPVVHGLEDTIDTMTPVAGLVADSYILVVAGSQPASDARVLLQKDTVAAVPKRGGNTDIQAMLLNTALSSCVSMEVIHDAGETLMALADGRVDWTTGVYSDFASSIESGDLRVLATFEPRGVSAALAASLIEQGIEVMFPLWRGVVAPGSIGDRLAIWTVAIQLAVTQPPWLDYLARERQRGAYLDPPAFAELLAAENVRYVGWLDELGA